MIVARASFAERAPSRTAFGLPVELYSDVDATAEGRIERQRRQRLIDAIRQLPAYAADRGFPTPSPSGLRIAVDFVCRLPMNRELPKVAVDDEGDVLMDWNTPAGRCSLTFEGSVLHMVVDPGLKSTHIEPTIYNGGHIPYGLLDYIPQRR